MIKMKRILLKPRVIILIIALLFSLLAIHPAPFNEGVAINGVVKDSPAYYAGIQNPNPNLQPVQKEVIKQIIYNYNTYNIKNVDDYNNIIKTIIPGDSFIINTNKNTYSINLTYFDKENYDLELQLIEENITKNTIKNNTNNTNNNTTNNTNLTIIKEKLKQKYTYIYNNTQIGLYVSNAPKSNLRLGLDLAGGTRVLLKIDSNNTIPQELYDRTIDSIKERLNAFGLSEVIVRPSSDLLGNQYILVELSNINSQEVKDLLSKQGKFEAKIKNNIVFEGGKDITYVCRSATCSGIDPYRGCQEIQGGSICYFSFEIALSPEAAERQAKYTKNLTVIPQPGGEGYLSENLTLYLDGEKVDELRIGAGLKGSKVTNIRISGSGTGQTIQEAQQNALEQMKKLQTILETGKLPVKLKIVQVDNISPTLGAEFLKNALLVGLVALIAVILILTFVYKKAVLSIPIIITGLSEVFIILGIAALIKWNLDLVSIAGIIVAIGTGVDDQIVITDETLNKENKRRLTWKEKIKNAFFIILGAYFTTLVAMLPLMSAGAGLLKGFALTTIIGISIGVFITRPAFADILSTLIEKTEKKE